MDYSDLAVLLKEGVSVGVLAQDVWNATLKMPTRSSLTYWAAERRLPLTSPLPLQPPLAFLCGGVVFVGTGTCQAVRRAHTHAHVICANAPCLHGRAMLRAARGRVLEGRLFLELLGGRFGSARAGQSACCASISLFPGTSRIVSRCHFRGGPGVRGEASI